MDAKQYTGRWLVGVSAGPDSMALLAMCLEAGIDAAAAHVNYHHQKQAEQEEEYLRGWCAERHVTLHVRNDAFAPAGNFEAAARTWRYAFFAQLCRDYGYRGVMIAHQQDDHIETFLLQQERGQIPETWGLAAETVYAGMRVVRPLLGYTRKELMAYCAARGIRYYLDETNDSDEYTRNRIRHAVVEPMTPFERQMVLREIAGLNAEWKERRCRVKTEIREERIDLSRYRRMELTDRLTLLRMFLKDSGAGTSWSAAHLEQMDSVLLKQNDFLIPAGDKQLVTDRGYLRCIDPAEPYAAVFADREAMRWQVYGHFAVQPGVPGVNAVTLQPDDFPLTIRSWQPGDRIRMRYGTKSVHRFFIDRHIPRWQRPLWPVVVNAGGTVILVPGLGCDTDHYSIKPDYCVIQLANSEGEAGNA
ncbi:MAG: tRNA lysidine(34) synthetase TilS [Solobacterium sp.]|nr:tRNA lysidine(34) synthetase TilS [Solobacterium sp.]